MPTKPKVRVAVIGAGNMGRNHVRNFSNLVQADLVALVDVNPQAKSLADEYQTQYYSDYITMLDEQRPEAVSIVVPTPFHYAVAEAVISRGIHTLLEKPITATVEEADQLIALARKHKIVFTAGHIEHYNPVVIKLKQIIDSQTIGEITSVVCKRVGGFPQVEPKTDVIIDLAVHDIDIISYLLGSQPKHIYSHGSRTRHSKKIDSAEILIDYGQASGFVQANWLTPVKIRTIAITGSLGYVEANYITQELTCYKHNMQRSEGFSNFVTVMGEPEKEIIKVNFKEPLAVELKTFLNHIQGDKKIHLVDPFAAREALRLALEAVRPYEEVENK